MSPTDYGSSANGNLLQSVWFDGLTLPDALFLDRDNSVDNSKGCSDNDETTTVDSTEYVDADTHDCIEHDPSDDAA